MNFAQNGRTFSSYWLNDAPVLEYHSSNGIPGHGYREKYLGESVIIFVDMFILDLKGEKEKTKLVQTRKSAAAHRQDLTPIEELVKTQDIIVPDIPVNNPYGELLSMINSCITVLEAFRDKLMVERCTSFGVSFKKINALYGRLRNLLFRTVTFR